MKILKLLSVSTIGLAVALFGAVASANNQAANKKAAIEKGAMAQALACVEGLALPALDTLAVDPKAFDGDFALAPENYSTIEVGFQGCALNKRVDANGDVIGTMVTGRIGQGSGILTESWILADIEMGAGANAGNSFANSGSYGDRGPSSLVVVYSHCDGDPKSDGHTASVLSSNIDNSDAHDNREDELTGRLAGTKKDKQAREKFCVPTFVAGDGGFQTGDCAARCTKGKTYDSLG